MNFPGGRILLLLVLLAGAAGPAPAAAETFPLQAYADVGYVFGDSGKFGKLGWTEAQFDAFLEGLRDSFHGKAHEPGAASEALNERIAHRLEQIEREEAQAFTALLKDPARREKYINDLCRSLSLERSDSGLAHGIQGQSGSVRPEPNDTVIVTWSVRAADMKTELPQLNATKISMKVSDLLPGLAEGVQMMSAGSAALLVLPPELSFGSGKWPPGIEAGVPLVFMVRLEEIIPGS